MKQPQKIYAPAFAKAGGRRLKTEVSRFERQTSFCPLYLAWRIVDAAGDLFSDTDPRSLRGQTRPWT